MAANSSLGIHQAWPGAAFNKNVLTILVAGRDSSILRKGGRLRLGGCTLGYFELRRHFFGHWQQRAGFRDELRRGWRAAHVEWMIAGHPDPAGTRCFAFSVGISDSPGT